MMLVGGNFKVWISLFAKKIDFCVNTRLKMTQGLAWFAYTDANICCRRQKPIDKMILYFRTVLGRFNSQNRTSNNHYVYQLKPELRSCNKKGNFRSLVYWTNRTNYLNYKFDGTNRTGPESLRSYLVAGW